MRVDAPGAGVVGSERPDELVLVGGEAIQQLPQVAGSAPQILGGDLRVYAEFGGRAGHKLHQADGSLRRHGVAPETGLRPDHSSHEFGRNAGFLGDLGDEGPVLRSRGRDRTRLAEFRVSRGNRRVRFDAEDQGVRKRDPTPIGREQAEPAGFPLEPVRPQPGAVAQHDGFRRGLDRRSQQQRARR